MHRRDALRWIGMAAAAAGSGWLRGETPARLNTRPIPSTGEALPLIGLGTWQTFDVGPSPEERAPLQEVLAAFAAAGGKLVDSSPMYGRAEEVLGDLTARLGLRPKLFLATKVWTSGKQAGVAQMEASLRKLRADRLDLMQVHNLLDMERHLETLRAWKAAGRVRYIGITHYTASAHEAVARAMTAHPVDFVQINYSVGEREAERRVLPLALERGVAVLANRPFAGGDLLRRLRTKPLPAFAGEIGCTSWAQLLLKFVVGHPAITCAIPATSKVAHLRDNMAAAQGVLPDATLRQRIAAEAT
jgi:diketogulonate reductase-like aldo/keto reductase